MSLLGSIEKSIFCRFFLTLAHRNVSELLVTYRNIVFCSYSLYFRSWVNSREQDEEDWNSVVGLSKGLENVEGRLLNVSFTHHLTNEGSQS